MEISDTVRRLLTPDSPVSLGRALRRSTVIMKDCARSGLAVTREPGSRQLSLKQLRGHPSASCLHTTNPTIMALSTRCLFSALRNGQRTHGAQALGLQKHPLISANFHRHCRCQSPMPCGQFDKRRGGHRCAACRRAHSRVCRNPKLTGETDQGLCE